ncbi:MAG: glycoside hydrolase family 3 C-terminal domain-containing protein, partial [Gammaproteobacteria bacterium]
DLDALLDALLAELTLAEKVTLLTGRGFWTTQAIPRLGIPALKVTDGPNGARGDGVSGRSAASFPVGVALGSTWNPTLVAAVGRAIGEEALTKDAQVVLGPTINLHRTPIGGRNFECYGEDPWLTGALATAFVQGVQSVGVGACPKHFVCNDSEFERHTISSEVDERTLREVYLTPFETTVRDADPWTLMSAYNRVNGIYASSHAGLLRDILRTEWHWDGLVISDWGAALETEANINGGLDLEMPGPTRSRGAALIDAVHAGRVSEETIDAAVRRLLRLLQRSGRFDRPDSQPEQAIDQPAHRAIARQAAAEGMVLLRNRTLANAEAPVLPLDPRRIGRLAVIGPNATLGQIQGGGSSAVFPHYTVMPLEGLKQAANWSVTHATGCFNHKYLPIPDADMLSHAQPDGTRAPGLWLDFFNPDSSAPARAESVVLTFNPMGGLPLNMIGGRHVQPGFSARLTGEFTPATSGEHGFGLLSSGLTRMFLDDVEIIDNWTQQEPGQAFFSWGSTERRAARSLTAGQTYRLRIEFASKADVLVTGVRYGILPPQPADPIAEAVAAARAADAAVVVVGTNADWDTEGNDRSNLSLPGDQDALVDAVIDANPNTIVVVNAGGAVAMPWLERAGAVVYAWLPGQAFGQALADVLTGTVDASGRLPTTFPARLEDTPAFTSYPGEFGRVRYGEGLFMGYRWYDSRGIEPLLPFGHGLSYTTFSWSGLTLAADGAEVIASFEITNTGARPGAAVAQLYVTAPDAPVQRPLQELRGFAKPVLQPGERTRVELRLGPRAFAFWDITAGRFRAAPGRHEIRVGPSSRDLPLRAVWTRQTDDLL